MAGEKSWIGARRMLRQLRDAMAGHGSAQERLDRTTQIIARGMIAEVCSVYVLRPGDILELFATEGLRKDAVHRTRLRIGEGLVGDIAAYARPLALSDAQAHPQFAYRPETGEEIFHSLLGVPVLRGRRVLGVLVVQNKTERRYAEEETETLETIAMVLAELVAGGELVRQAELTAMASPLGVPSRLNGTRLNGGLGFGPAVLHRRGTAAMQTVSEDPERELLRLNQAIDAMHQEIDAMLELYDGEGGGEHIDILRTYRMFAEDRGWMERVREGVRSGLTGEAAVSKVLDDTRARMQDASDPYIRERLMDLDDLGYRLLQHLTGEQKVSDAITGEDGFVLIARSMGPAELLDYDRDLLRGLVLEEASYNSHVAIVARSMGLPVIGSVGYVLSQVEEGAPVLVDGDSGVVVIRPGAEFQARIRESIELRERHQAELEAIRELPAVTCDGTEISLMTNAGLLIDLEHLRASGADGVGLLRTEVAFMLHSSFPNVAEQRDLYTRIFDAVEDRPVIFRTFDIGGDKLLPYFDGSEDENPAMGWRAMRIAMDRPLMLCRQLRALIEAASGRELHIMFPMVSEVAEFDAARELVHREWQVAKERGTILPTTLKVGAMLEVPSLYFQLSALLQRVDFLSIGSNDLLQFLFASDRGNPLVGERYDTLSPAVLNFLRDVIRQCDQAGVPVSICGEMAGAPLEAMVLIGIGFRRLSMSASSVGGVRMMIRSLDTRELAAYLATVLGGPDRTLRYKLAAFARDHGFLI
uniref:phosphoenolpyruvate--protein phosphotransferase n=1 Tax=uncultured Rhodospirillales bacterium HF0070_31K06 TaxID=710786 RepID=E0XSP8_9PROT|nr:signal transduction protein containing gaf and ptsi domains [uncultured Rhodospirillales bacterium HF0070_31K06]